MSLGGGDLQVILRRIRHGKPNSLLSLNNYGTFLLSGFIICDDTELCDKIISQDVENEQRRRTLAKSYVELDLAYVIDLLLLLIVGNRLTSTKAIC
jgi:hypothetical protein